MTDVGIEVPGDPDAISRFRALGFFPADYAAVESGKIYASGAYWAVLRFPAYPAGLSTMALVAVIEVPFHASQADHKLEMGLVDADGKPLPFRVDGTFRSAPTIDHPYGEPGVAPVAVPITGLTFERPGSYSFFLKVDGVALARYPFTVLQATSVP